MKVLVIGNCQARPIAALLGRVPDIEILDVYLIHLAHDKPSSEIMQRVNEADLVLSQQTFGTTWQEYLRSNILAERFPEKTLVWPNVFFTGQQPYLRYATHPKRGRLLSPLTEYHDLFLLRDWYRHRKGLDFSKEIMAPSFADDLAEASLDTLRRRETLCDVGVSDLIEARYRTERLFFTFNHPRLWLLAKLAERALDRIGKPCRIDISGMREPLDRVRPFFALPKHEADREVQFQGVEIDLGTPGKVSLGSAVHYSRKDLWEVTFAGYDHQWELLEDPAALRLTP